MRKALLALAVVAAGLSPLPSASAASADDGGTTTLSGYVARYPSIRYNTSGGVNTITPTGGGTFLVRFPGLAAPGGAVLVTPYSSGDMTCQPRYWLPEGADEIVSVACATRSGPADSANFSVLFTRPARGSTGPYGYVWANNPAEPNCYTPSWPYQVNSTGATNTVCRTGPGRWTVDLPGLGGSTNGGHVQVNAYGWTTARCGVEYWYAGGASVLCTTPTGAPVDTHFTLLFSDGVSLLGHNRFVQPGTLGAGYVWAYQPFTPGTYTANGYSWNATGAGNTVTRLELGRYQVHFPNIIRLGGISQVTTYGATTAHCTAVGSESGYLTVACFDTAGNPADSYFTAAYLNAGQT